LPFFDESEATVARADDLTKRERYEGELLTPDEMSDADRRAIARGVSGFDLMEAAGRAIAEAVQARWYMRPVAVLCGPGNNGGDGFAAARHLASAGWPIRLALLGTRDDLSGDAANHADLWQGAAEPFSPEILDGADVVLDAIFGAGLSRPVEGTAGQMIEALKARKIATCAVDVPSGVDGATGSVRGTAAPADITVTFFRKKPGHLLFPGRFLCGSVVLADIGIPAAVLEAIEPRTYENGPDLWLDRYPWPSIDGHKYLRGHALVLGGDTLTGASRLTARGAMHAGAGLVTLAAPAPTWMVYAASLIGVIVRSFDGVKDFNALLADERRNAIAIGPGAGVGSATRQYVLAALAMKRAVVLDADALTSFADESGRLFSAVAGPCVLTPHEGEFARLFDFKGDKLQRARSAAAKSNAIVLLKGADTVIAAPDGRAIINSNAPPQLATGGSGDVLTGFIAGLLAQGLDAFYAAAVAAWLHGEAAAAVGLGLVAEDLPEALPQVLQRLKSRLL
jgi:ADP-dependent NAD(P)H-hydrate dehydratase / NAD(P)H-hydrate epimerase